MSFLTFLAQIDDIKKENRLWNRNDIFTRSKLTIPVDIEEYKKRIQEKEKEKEIEIKQNHSLVQQFCEATQCDEETAKLYLGQFSFNNYERSLERYLFENISESPRPLPPKIHHHVLIDDDDDDDSNMFSLNLEYVKPVSLKLYLLTSEIAFNL